MSTGTKNYALLDRAELLHKSGLHHKMMVFVSGKVNTKQNPIRDIKISNM
jgi:hypothetical protein